MFECIPNISEGRDDSIILAAEKAITSAQGVKLLHTDTGFDANRTVFTFIGNAAGIEQAVLALYEVCLDRIDLRTHNGVHPRMGAVDVCPIVPLNDLSLDSADDVARNIASEVADIFSIPVYLYEHSQKREYRRKLSSIRRGQFEGLSDKLKEKEWQPDFGPAKAHSSFGATVIGARGFLIAFNISLESENVAVAREIAKILRDYRASPNETVARKWQGIRAIGWQMPKYNCVQVSTNLVDMNLINLADVYVEVKRLADVRGIRTMGSELIGLVPKRALSDAAVGFGQKRDDKGIRVAVEMLNLSCHSSFNFSDRILENHLQS